MFAPVLPFSHPVISQITGGESQSPYQSTWSNTNEYNVKLDHTIPGHRLLSSLLVEFDPGCEAMIFTVDGIPLQGLLWHLPWTYTNVNFRHNWWLRSWPSCGVYHPTQSKGRGLSWIRYWVQLQRDVRCPVERRHNPTSWCISSTNHTFKLKNWTSFRWIAILLLHRQIW